MLVTLTSVCLMAVQERPAKMTESWSLRYIKIRGFAILLNAIGPLCAAYCLIAPLLTPTWRLPLLLECYALSEAGFLALSLLYRKFYVQRASHHPDPAPLEQRRKLFHQTLDDTEDYEAYISKWFLGARVADIKRENMKEFLRWAFFNLGEHDPSHDTEVEEYLTQMEQRSGFHFEPGRSSVQSLRLTIDKVYALHRSLTWYFCILVVDTLTTFFLLIQGFQHYRASLASSILALPPRPQALLAPESSPCGDLSYWYQPHTSKKERPILFLHGIGVGLWPYTDFFKEINESRSKEDGQIGILAIELLQITNRLTTPILRRKAMCKQIKTILDRHGYTDFVLVSHSYGSVISTYLLKDPDVAPRINSILLVDPITLLLSQPDVAYNFTVRKPYTAQQWLIWYFGSKDIGVAHTLGRHFFWQDNILQREDLEGHNSTVFLSSDDCIVNASMVRQYLLRGAVEEREVNGSAHTGKDVLKHQRVKPGQALSPTIATSDNGTRVIWGDGLDHAQSFDVPVWRTVLRNEAVRLAQMQPRRNLRRPIRSTS